MPKKSTNFALLLGGCAAAGLALTLLAANAEALDAGAKMPEVGLNDLSGKPVSLASLAGKVVVIDFWATWCAPCKEELPVLQKLHKKYGSQGLAIVGISVDKDAANLPEFLKKLAITFPIVHDANHSVTGRYAPPRMPSSYIVDRKGLVKFVHGGFRADDAATFEKQIQGLLAAK
jgi:cytochrome c biogenesis protein CcmG, thiol:disulfide interchange protein DsbE